MSPPWITAPRLAADEFARLRRRAIFDCCKWDPQVEDVCTLAPYPLLLTPSAWRELVELARALARETLAAESELASRPELHAMLGLPRRAERALSEAARHGPSRGVARLVRFDFHYTGAGWRISEANSDVPGGLNEASGIPALIAPHYPETASVGDPAERYVAALLESVPGATTVALLHATAYSDDNQMMTYLARRLREHGVQGVLASPAQVSWRAGEAWIGALRADVLVRFFPADWLADLPAHAGWTRFYSGSRTPLSNPATALLTQSKRWPLVWDQLHTPVPAWRSLLPETGDPREVTWQRSDEWIIKPALGRVGEDIAIPGLVTEKDCRRLHKECARHPRRWVAQRRFDIAPLEMEGGVVYPCIGIYTVDDRVVGAYGRLARRPLIDGRAEDAAVLTFAGAA